MWAETGRRVTTLAFGPDISSSAVQPVRHAETALANARKAEGDERCKQWGLVQTSMLKNWDLLPTAAPTTYFFSRGIDFFPAGFNYSVLFLKKAT